KLTQYRARDAWAVRMLSEALPAVQVIRNLGIHRETIAAVAPLLELPAPEETREMLRGQPRGDWRRERDRPGRPQPATSDAGSGGGTVSTRRPSRAEMQRRVRAARNAAAQAPVLTEALERILAGYEPEDCEPTVWEAVRPVVRQVMERSGTRTAEAF